MRSVGAAFLVSHIPHLGENIQARTQHAAPVGTHQLQCLLLTSNPNERLEAVLHEIGSAGQHSTLQRLNPIKGTSGLVRREDFRHRKPSPGGPGNLSAGALWQSLRADEGFAGYVAQLTKARLQGENLPRLPEAPGETQGAFCTPDHKPMDTRLLLQALLPVDKPPEVFRIVSSAVAQSDQDLQLPHGNRQQLDTGGLIPCVIHIIGKGRRKQRRIIHGVGLAVVRLGFLIQAGGHETVFAGHCGKEIETAFHHVELAEADTVGERLKAQVADPKPAITLGAVFKHRLHAVAQGPQTGHGNGVVTRTQALGNPWSQILWHGCDAFALDIKKPDSKGMSTNPDDLNPHIAEGVTPRQCQLMREAVKGHYLVLQPVAAEAAHKGIERLDQLGGDFRKNELQTNRRIVEAAIRLHAQPEAANPVLAKVQNDSIPIGKRGQVRRITRLRLDLPSLKSGWVRNDLDQTLWFYLFPTERRLESIRDFQPARHRFIHNGWVAAT